MKKRNIGLFILGIASICFALIAQSGELTDKKLKYPLKENGRIQCEVVVPDEAGTVALFAGKEIQKYLSQSLNGEVALLKAPSNQKTALILGSSQQLRDAGIDIKKLPRDAFVIKSAGKNILIAGRDDMKVNLERMLNSGSIWQINYEHATIFAAYEFLERFVGIRFYFPGEMGTIVPKHDSLELAEINISEAPDFEVRLVSFVGPVSGTIDWTPNEKEAKGLDALRMRLETKYIPCCHGLNNRGYLERFGESHPEYFALMPDGKRYKEPSMERTGQLCFSSGIREEIYKDAEAYFTGKTAKERGVVIKLYGAVWDPSSTQPGYFDLMPNDGFYECKCEKCQAHFSKGPQATSDFIWGFVIEVAEKLKKNKIPGCLTMMAYDPYRMLPTMKIPDNVMVMVGCGGPWRMYKGDTFKWESDLIKSWKSKMYGNKPWLWNYACKFGKLAIPNIPATTPYAIGEYYRKISPDIIGAFLETELESKEADYIYNYLNHYVFGKVAWKNSTDVNALLKEHHRLMFGAAAPQMEQVFKTIEEKWHMITGNPIETPTGPQAVPLSDYDIWEKAYSKVEMQRLENLFDESEKAVSNDTDALKRVKFIRERFFAPLEKQRAEYEKNQVAINDLRFQIKEIPVSAKMIVDAKLDETAWNDSVQIKLLPYASEKTKKDIGIKTIVRALRDAEKLYFAFECEEPDMDKLLSGKRKNDDPELWKDSAIEIFLNPSGDRDKYYQIIVNADGCLADYSGSKSLGPKNLDITWNSEAQVAAIKGHKSWIVEMAIPIKNIPELKIDNDFPANFTRSRILTKVPDDHAMLFTFSPFLRGGFHDIDNFGYITFKDSKSPNIIRNSLFNGNSNGNVLDGWVLPWKPKEFESWGIVDDPFTESGKCLKMTRNSPEKGAISATQYLPELKPDTNYVLTFALKIEGLNLLPGSRNTGVVANIWDDKNNWFPKNYYTSDMPWTRQGFKFRSGPQTNKAPHKSYISMTIMDAACTAKFGDIKIQEEQAKDSKTF